MKFIDLPSGISDADIMENFSQLRLSGEEVVLVCGATGGFKPEFLAITNMRIIPLRGKDFKLKAPPAMRSDIDSFEIKIQGNFGSLHIAHKDSVPRLFGFFDSSKAAELAEQVLSSTPVKPPVHNSSATKIKVNTNSPVREVQNFHPTSSSNTKTESKTPNQVPEPYKSNVDPNFRYSFSSVLDNTGRVKPKRKDPGFLSSLFIIALFVAGAFFAAWFLWQVFEFIGQIFSGIEFNENVGDNGFLCNPRRGCIPLP